MNFFFCNKNYVLNLSACLTRPDIAKSVGILSHFSTRPSHFCVSFAKQIFSYYEATCDYKLTIILFQNNSKLKFLFNSGFAPEKTGR